MKKHKLEGIIKMKWNKISIFAVSMNNENRV